MCLLLICGAFFVQNSYAQKNALPALSLTEIVTGLKSTTGDFTFEERIKYLIDSVKVRGVDFLFTTANETALKEAAANSELLEIIREESMRTTASLDDISKANNLYTLGLDFNDKGNYQQAIENFQQAIALNPRLSYAYGGLGLAYFNQKEFEKAVEFFSKALAAKPDPAFYYNRAAAYYSIKEFNKAIRDYNQIIETKPTDAKAFLSRGMAYFSNNEPEKAIKDYEKVLELEPDNKDIPAKMSSAKKWMEVLEKRKQKQSELQQQ